jgi:hypothetical protein
MRAMQSISINEASKSSPAPMVVRAGRFPSGKKFYSPESRWIVHVFKDLADLIGTVDRYPEGTISPMG